MMKITEQILQAGKSLNGGWSKAQTDLLGVAWPLKHGWKKEIIGKEMADDDYKKFLHLKDQHLTPEVLTRVASKMLKRKAPKPKMTRAAKKAIYARGRLLVDTFSGPDGSGTHLTTCTKEKCLAPLCLCT